MNQPKKKPAVVFVEGTMIGAGEHCVRAAQDLGLVPIFISSEPGNYPFLENYACEVVVLKSADDVGILQAIDEAISGKELEIVGIGTTNDNMSLPVIAAAKSLGLEHPDPVAVENCKDKSATRALVPGQSPKFASVFHEDDLEHCQPDFPGETVVKPTSLNSGLGVKHCRNWAETVAHVEHLYDAGLVIRDTQRQQILVEEYVSGQEFSVEVFDGRALGVTQIEIDDSVGFVEVSHLHPSGEPQELHDLLKTLAEDAVRATGLTWGPAHIQYRYNGESAKLIEINPRLGGGNVTQCVEYSRGIRLAHAYVRKICRLSGVENELQNTKSLYSVVKFVLTQNGDPLRQISGLNEALASRSIVEVGTRVRQGERYAVRGSNHDRLAFAISAADTPTSATSDARSAAEQISIETSATREAFTS